MKFLYIAFVTFLVAACVKDRVITKVPENPDNTTSIKENDIVINELVAKGSLNANEYGTTEDWFELYNTTNKTIVLEAGKWFVTDDSNNEKRKYQLPEITLNAGEFVIIWCDGLDKVETQIHTNFNLSANGEDLGLYYDKDGEDFEVDQITYPTQSKDGYSYGRQTNGSDIWKEFAVPTPSASNN
jgi:hypothetical protein